jgi:hypothetical protein
MKEENSLCSTMLCSVPVMSKKRFSELTGFGEGVIEGWVDRGQIPSVKIGKHNAINLVLITSNCLSQLPLDNDDN